MTDTASIAADTTRVEDSGPSGIRRVLGGSVGRNLGLVVALLLLVLVGALTAPDRFLTGPNFLVIANLAAVIGVVSVGMTFVITAGGIDLSVGSVLGLASVVGSLPALQEFARSGPWWLVVVVAIAVGAFAGLVNGVVIAYGKVVAFMATLAMLVAARGAAELIANRRTFVLDVPGFTDVWRGAFLGVPFIVWVFIIVAALGWFLFNRTTFGRRTVAIGGNAEAARLAGVNVRRHMVWLYVLSGTTAGIGAVMMLARTTSGTSTHGTLYELDAIAAVVVGGTLLIGGRGTIVGTVLGVLLFTTLTNVFIMNNLSTSVQALVKGAIIVVAVLLQQRFARSRTT